jgi:hypothetical protein
LIKRLRKGKLSLSLAQAPGMKGLQSLPPSAATDTADPPTASNDPLMSHALMTRTNGPALRLAVGIVVLRRGSFVALRSRTGLHWPR